MNCNLCLENLDAYRGGKLPGDMETLIASHLETCESCAKVYRLQVIAEKVIDHEKESESDPFMVTRVMALIENPAGHEHRIPTTFNKVLKPILVAVSLAAAVFSGIVIGNLSGSGVDRTKIPFELTLMDDASLESVDFLINE